MDCFHSHTGHPSSCAEGSAIFRPFSRTGYWTVCLKHQCLWRPRKEKIALKAPSRNTLYLPHSSVLAKQVTWQHPALRKVKYNPAVYLHTLKATIHPAPLPFSYLQNNPAHF